MAKWPEGCFARLVPDPFSEPVSACGRLTGKVQSIVCDDRSYGIQFQKTEDMVGHTDRDLLHSGRHRSDSVANFFGVWICTEIASGLVADGTQDSDSDTGCRARFLLAFPLSGS